MEYLKSENFTTSDQKASDTARNSSVILLGDLVPETLLAFQTGARNGRK